MNIWFYIDTHTQRKLNIYRRKKSILEKDLWFCPNSYFNVQMDGAKSSFYLGVILTILAGSTSNGIYYLQKCKCKLARVVTLSFPDVEARDVHTKHRRNDGTYFHWPSSISMVLHIHSTREVRSRDALRSRVCISEKQQVSKSRGDHTAGEKETGRERICVRVLFMCEREKGEDEGGECERANGAELVILDLTWRNKSFPNTGVALNAEYLTNPHRRHDRQEIYSHARA